jgi:hypothetical protein
MIIDARSASMLFAWRLAILKFGAPESCTSVRESHWKFGTLSDITYDIITLTTNFRRRYFTNKTVKLRSDQHSTITLYRTTGHQPDTRHPDPTHTGTWNTERDTECTMHGILAYRCMMPQQQQYGNVQQPRCCQSQNTTSHEKQDESLPFTESSVGRTLNK